jgi:hypothetical protein
VRLKNNTIYFTIISIPLIINFLSIDKKATISSVLLISVISIFRKSFFSTQINRKETSVNLKKLYLYLFLFFLLIFILITQNQYLNFETIEWDTASYLVASQEIKSGNIPNETQWESKGPLFFYIYNVISNILSNNYLLFRIANDFILWFVALILVFTSLEKNRNYRNLFLPSIFFTLIMSQTWAVSEYSELYSLFFIALSYMLTKKREINIYTLILCGFLISLATLINQGAVLFIFPYIVLIISNKHAWVKNMVFFLSSFTIPHLFFLFLYLQNNLFDVYFATYVSIPLGYTGASFSNLYELKVFIRKFFEYDFFLYFAFLLIVIFSFINKLTINKSQFFSVFTNLINLNIICSLLFYFIGSHNYYHHLIFAIYFISLLSTEINSSFQKNLIILLLIISSINIFNRSYEDSINNIVNFEETFNNYPLQSLASDIDSNFKDEYTVLALDYVLILYYLDKPNFSYIVHPSNHFETFITEKLSELGLISENHISDMINEFPDVIICNPKMIIRGEPTKIDTYNCAVDDYYKNYKRLDTSKYLQNENLNYYYDPYKELNVFIKQEK